MQWDYHSIFSVLFSLLRGQVAEKFELSQYSFYIRAIYSVTPFNAVKLIKKNTSCPWLSMGPS